mmetsp:Transcript_43248/g.88393  ORF Transcript_43248/g.88393 Transcript_43248/m.88393 type:complete len:233 (-) Transcript_43248:137-835(-)
MHSWPSPLPSPFRYLLRLRWLEDLLERLRRRSRRCSRRLRSRELCRLRSLRPLPLELLEDFPRLLDLRSSFLGSSRSGLIAPLARLPWLPLRDLLFALACTCDFLTFSSPLPLEADLCFFFSFSSAFPFCTFSSNSSTSSFRSRFSFFFLSSLASSCSFSSWSSWMASRFACSFSSSFSTRPSAFSCASRAVDSSATAFRCASRASVISRLRSTFFLLLHLYSVLHGIFGPR